MQADEKFHDLFNYEKGIFVGMDIPMYIECKRCNAEKFQCPRLHLMAKYPCIQCAIHIESWEPNDKESKSEHWAHVFDGLYIGDIFAAQNIAWIQNNQFGGVVDLSNSPTIIKFPPQIDVLRIAVDDNAHSKLTPYFKRSHNFIASYLDKKKKVLVFCRAGISRSATITIHYLMKSFSLTVEDAISFLKKARPQIQPNNGFMRQLREQYNSE